MYTKGEWKVREIPNHFGDRCYVVETDTPNATLAVAIMSGFDDYAEANARLIASAPDLYEALKVAHRELLHAQWEDGLDQIEQALAKAK